MRRRSVVVGASRPIAVETDIAGAGVRATTMAGSSPITVQPIDGGGDSSGVGLLSFHEQLRRFCLENIDSTLWLTYAYR